MEQTTIHFLYLKCTSILCGSSALIEVKTGDAPLPSSLTHTISMQDPLQISTGISGYF